MQLADSSASCIALSRITTYEKTFARIGYRVQPAVAARTASGANGDGAGKDRISEGCEQVIATSDRGAARQRQGGVPARVGRRPAFGEARRVRAAGALQLPCDRRQEGAALA